MDLEESYLHLSILELSCFGNLVIETGQLPMT